MIQKFIDWFRNFFGLHQANMPSHQGHQNGRPEHGSGLFLSKQQLNRTIALLLISALFIFIGGYFWGQHTATEQLLTMVERDSFSDQVYYSMCSVNDRGDDEADAEESDKAAETSEQDVGVTVTAVAIVPVVVSEDVKVKEDTKPKQQKNQFVGVLAGFSTEKMAKQLVKRLQHRGFDVRIVTRYSKAKGGRTVAWYQVVTAPVPDRTDLERLIAQIKKFEKLHDVSIKPYSGSSENLKR